MIKYINSYDLASFVLNGNNTKFKETRKTTRRPMEESFKWLENNCNLKECEVFNKYLDVGDYFMYDPNFWYMCSYKMNDNYEIVCPRVSISNSQKVILSTTKKKLTNNQSIYSMHGAMAVYGIRKWILCWDDGRFIRNGEWDDAVWNTIENAFSCVSENMTTVCHPE